MGKLYEGKKSGWKSDYSISDMHHSEDAVAIIHTLLEKSESMGIAHRLAVDTLTECLCQTEPNGLSVRCDWCGGGAAVFKLPMDDSKEPDAVCIWCVSDKIKMDKKNKEKE